LWIIWNKFKNQKLNIDDDDDDDDDDYDDGDDDDDDVRRYSEIVLKKELLKQKVTNVLFEQKE